MKTIGGVLIEKGPEDPKLFKMEKQLRELSEVSYQRIVKCEQELGVIKINFWSKQPQLRIVDDDGGNWTLGWQQFGGRDGDHRIAVLNPSEETRQLVSAPRLIMILACKQLDLFRKEIGEILEKHLLAATK